MEINCPFCENSFDVLNYDNHLTNDCESYKKAKEIMLRYNINIEKLTSILQKQHEVHIETQTKFNQLSQLKKDFPSLIEQALYEQALKTTGIPEVMLDYLNVDKYRKKIREGIKEKTNQIINSLQNMALKVVKKETIEEIKEDLKKGTKKIWQMLKAGAAGSGLTATIICVYYFFLGIADYRLITISVTGMTLLISLLHKNKEKVKEKLSWLGKLKFWKWNWGKLKFWRKK